jgi:hypothetical protein
LRQTLVGRDFNEEDYAMATEEIETVSLIGSDKVEGTAVYGADEK